MDKKLKWRHLKGLNQIYSNGFTTNKISEHPYIKRLIKREKLGFSAKYPKRLEKGIGFEKYYEKEHLKNFSYYQSFLEGNEILKDQSNYLESDIKRLIFIKKEKKEILKNKYSRKKFSAQFFKSRGAKHLDNNNALEIAVLKILGIDEFHAKDPKDQQYLYVITCKSPETIVLCENLDFLLLPWDARDNNIELWYAGGNNIKKLDHLPPITSPIFYSCDWDYEGLRIYERIKGKIPKIKLLYPNAVNDSKPTDSDNHESDWLYDKPFSNLKDDLYLDHEKKLINKLISKKHWIEEENNDLIEMMRINKI